uniref:Uncharacterized protein n=1 Tax=Arion vulgaris TaxID=1028688 RepID=A0A0B7AL04_9EUPU
MLSIHTSPLYRCCEHPQAHDSKSTPLEIGNLYKQHPLILQPATLNLPKHRPRVKNISNSPIKQSPREPPEGSSNGIHKMDFIIWVARVQRTKHILIEILIFTIKFLTSKVLFLSSQTIQSLKNSLLSYLTT